MSAWGLALAACTRLCARCGPEPGQAAASARPCLVRASPLDDETVRRHAGPLTASFHPAARACQHGDWHLLLPVPVFAHDAVPHRVRQQLPDPAWCALYRSMTKLCCGTLVRSRRPFTRPPAHVSMGTGTCCLYPSLHAPRSQTGSGSKCQTRPVVRASPLDDETVRRHDCLSTRTARKGCPCCSPATCPGQASGDRNPAVTMPASPAPRLAGP